MWEEVLLLFVPSRSQIFDAFLLSIWIYSPSHLVQITDFFRISPWILQGKIWNFHKILASLVVTENIKNSFGPSVLVKNQHKMHYHREFTCKRDVTLANLNVKLIQVPFMTIFAANIFILQQLHFHANKGKLNACLKIHIFYAPRFYYGKLLIICYFLLVLRNYCTPANKCYVN